VVPVEPVGRAEVIVAAGAAAAAATGPAAGSSGFGRREAGCGMASVRMRTGGPAAMSMALGWAGRCRFAAAFGAAMGGVVRCCVAGSALGAASHTRLQSRHELAVVMDTRSKYRSSLKCSK
jgi:hypothetical protein